MTSKSNPEQQEAEHYEVPPKLTVKDSVGIVVALLALAAISVMGYVWLTPGMTIGKLFGRAPATEQDGGTEMVARGATPAADGAVEHVSCDYCGMFADKSASYVMAKWSDGMMGHFDSWDCVFNYGKDKGLGLASAEVSRFGGAIESPEWINTDAAWYLFQTDQPVEGSMQPYVASFATRDEAAAKQAELGGELVDFATLRSKWQ